MLVRDYLSSERIGIQLSALGLCYVWDNMPAQAIREEYQNKTLTYKVIFSKRLIINNREIQQTTYFFFSLNLQASAFQSSGKPTIPAGTVSPLMATI